MHNELTNLLPFERQRLLRRNYFVRLGVIFLLLASALALAAAILLLPTYVLLGKSYQTKEARLASVESTLSSTDESSLSAKLSALSNDVATLTALETVPAASSVMRSILAIPHTGVSLSGFSYTPASGGSPGKVAISGTAASRDNLRVYQLALQNASFVSSADLPVSAYAKGSDIPFTIVVTLAP